MKNWGSDENEAMCGYILYAAKLANAQSRGQHTGNTRNGNSCVVPQAVHCMGRHDRGRGAAILLQVEFLRVYLKLDV